MARLPGLGPRSARRLVLHLIRKREGQMSQLLRALEAVAEHVVTCTTCGNADTIDPCAVCADVRRDTSMICVVEDIADLWALERSATYRGLYHVLGGTLSALDGIRPEDLRIPSLLERVQNSQVDEVILALGATVDGQTTAHYITRQLESSEVKLSAIAHGIPMGGELDYMDDGTLTAAMSERKPVVS